MSPFLRRWTPLALGLAAISCGNDSSAPPTPVDLTTYARTYSVVSVDSLAIPFVRSQDPSCQQINTGGWLSLSTDGTYQLMLDDVRSLCNGAPSGGGDAIYQPGTYTISSGILHLQPDAPYGPASSGPIVGATPIQGGGFKSATISLSFNSRLYYMVAMFQPPQ